MTLLLYRLALGAMRAVSPVLSAGSSKLSRGIAGRRRAHDEIASWGRTGRDPTRPVAWFHAPSVGEGLQAQAVFEALRARIPELQVVFTHFSPSAEALAGTVGADVAAYLPWDLRRPIRTALDAVRPDLVVFTKTEVWPVLTQEAGRLTIPVAIVAGSVPEGSGRLRGPARRLLSDSWRQLALAGASADADAERFIELGVAESRVHTTGDPGIDSALERFESVDARSPWLAPFHDDPRPTIVAGSTWPADEAVLWRAFSSVRSEVPALRVVIAPHEPTQEAVTRLLATFRDGGCRSQTLADVESSGSVRDVDVVVVDRVGPLSQLYSIASVSYVGGGFGDAGLHSVLEPAAAGTPVVFGPRHHSARAAEGLLAAGGAKTVQDVSALASALEEWLNDAAKREHSGRCAFGYIDARRGTAARTASLLDPLIRRTEG